MSDDAQETENQEPEVLSLPEFLETVPPNTWASVADIAVNHPNYRFDFSLAVPEIRLFCTSEVCNGYRFYSAGRPSTTITPGQTTYAFVTYTCRNCQRSKKLYSLWIMFATDGSSGRIMKLGESPEFGPPTPSRVIKLIGPDRELFLKGRRSENQGLGIGAFGYYRRVVENQKNRILDEVIKVSEKLGATEDLLGELKKAKDEGQFTKAIENIKHGIPQALLVDGHNPLSLLHSALSEGLHGQPDEECLALATSIRVVLTELADRLGQALKDEAELKHAVSRLLEVKAKKNG
jgi:hypothetical protein